MAEAKEIKSGIMQLNVNGTAQKSYSKEESKKKIAAAKERDSQIIEGVFENKETKGAILRFGFKLYPGDPIIHYELHDGETYALPRSVVRHIMENCYYYEYSHLNDFRGIPNPSDGRGKNGHYTPIDSDRVIRRKVYRFGFRTLDFRSDDLSFNRSNITEII